MRIQTTTLREGYTNTCDTCVWKPPVSFDMFCFGCSHYNKVDLSFEGNRQTEKDKLKEDK